MTRDEPSATVLGVLREIARPLHDEPMLLYGLGSVLVLTVVVGVAAGLGAAPLIVVVAGVLLLGSLIAGAVVKLRSSRATAAPAHKTTVKAGGADIGEGSVVGSINDSIGGTAETEVVTTGLLKVGRGATVGSISGTSAAPLRDHRDDR